MTMESAYQKAIATYEKVLSLDPSHREAHKDLGIIYWENGERDKALTCLQKAFDLGLASPELLCHLGMAYESAGWPDRAASQYKRALALSPSDEQAALARFRLGRLQFELGALDEALATLGAAHQLASQDNAVCLHIAFIHDEKGRLEQAAAWYRRVLALEASPEAAAQTHARLGLVYLSLGLVGEACDMASRALALEQDNGLAHAVLGAALLAQGLCSQAAAHLEERCRLDAGSASSLHLLGLAQQCAAQAERSLAACHLKLGRRQDDGALLVTAGRCCVTLGRHEEAVRLLEKAISLDLRNGEAHYHLARALSALGDRERARVCYQRYSNFKAQPSFEDFLNLGCMQALAGARDDALLAFQRAIALKTDEGWLEPWNAASLAPLGKAYERKGKLDGAIAMYRRAWSLGLGDRGVLSALGSACLEQGLFRDSLEAYCEANALDASRDRTSLSLAECHLSRGDFKRAMDAALERLASGPPCYRTFVALARAYLAMGMYDEAIAASGNVVAACPDALESHACPGEPSMGRRDLCEADWLAHEAYACLGGAFLGKGLWGDAVVSFQKALELDPKDALSFYRLGEAHEAQGAREEAEESFRMASALGFQPSGTGKDAAEGEDELGWVIAGQKRALELDPRNAEACKALGGAYARKGLHEEAVYFLRKALALKPADSDACLRLAAALEAMGDAAGAADMRDRAVRLQPQNPDVGLAVAQFYRDEDRPDKILETLKRLEGKDLAPAAAARMHVLAAEACQALQDHAAAIGHYEWLVRANSADNAMLKELARCWGLAHDDTKMLQYARQALARNPRDAELHRLVADHLFERGELAEALPHYQALVDLDAADSKVLARLGDGYLKRYEGKGEADHETPDS